MEPRKPWKVWKSRGPYWSLSAIAVALALVGGCQEQPPGPSAPNDSASPPAESPDVAAPDVPADASAFPATEPIDWPFDTLPPDESLRVDAGSSAEAGSASVKPEESLEQDVATATGDPGSVEDDPAFDLYSSAPWELGPPLVDDAAALVRLDPEAPVWLTADRKSVVFQGVIAQREAPLELFVCRRGSKEHESIIVVDLQPRLIQAGLIATGTEQGSPVVFYPEFSPATGPAIDVTVFWRGEAGEVQTARGQDWVLNVAEEESMQADWVFVGSQWARQEIPGTSRFMADRTGIIIALSNFPDAILDVSIESSGSNAARLYATYTGKIPARGTPITVVLTPRHEKTPDRVGPQGGAPAPAPAEESQDSNGPDPT